MNVIIEEQIDKWVSEYISDTFVFRPHQKEAISDIIENIVSSNSINTHIIEAPTGSGKSLIVIISAGVLDKFYHKTSYILCSDLFLFDQYADFIRQHPKLDHEYGMIKGQQGNYTCMRNNENIQNGECRLAKISWQMLFDEIECSKCGFECAQTCEYVRARQKALYANVTLMTYQLFLRQMSLNNGEENGGHTFVKHDVIFCDECHNIPDIVQTRMTPSIKNADFDDWLVMYRYVYDKYNNLFSTGPSDYKITTYSEKQLSEQYKDIFNELSNESLLGEDLLKVIDKYNTFLKMFKEIISDIQDDIAARHEAHAAFSQDDVKLYKTTSKFVSFLSIWADFNNTISESGIEYIIHQTINNDDGSTTITFNCIKEDWLTWNYLFRFATNRVLLSATIGGKEAFEDNIGIKFTETKTTKFDRIPSTFNFEKSPVFFLNRYKMSFKEKNESFEHLKEIVYNICREFKDKKGIIQTGSYDIAQKLMFYAPRDVQYRMLMYEGSKYKQSVVTEHKYSDNTILLGPTLCEGIDLPDDDCRFIVILKVPYPHLKDKLVNAKIKQFPGWYNSKTSNSIIQGIGRGVRNDHDYCTTYILDACFYTLYLNTKDQYSPELQKRIKMFN